MSGGSSLLGAPETHAIKRTYAAAADDSLLPVQKAYRYKQAFAESSNCSFVSEKISRPPLLPIDTNRTLSTASTHLTAGGKYTTNESTGRQKKNQLRILQHAEKKLKLKDKEFKLNQINEERAL